MSGDLRDAIVVTTLELWNGLLARVFGFIPNLVGALALLVLGYLLARLASRVVAAVLQRAGFDRAAARVGIGQVVTQAGIRAMPAEIVGRVVFWLLMLTFLVSAAEALALPNVSRTIDAFVLYLPNVIGAVVIAVVGLTLATFLRDLLRGGAASLGVDHARVLANVVYAVLVVIVGSLAVGQLQIETALFNRVVEIVLVAAGVALALALGLGTRDIAAHIVAGAYLRDLYRPGMEITIGEHDGALEQMGPIVTTLRTHDNRTVHIPNGRLTEHVVTVRRTSGT